MLILRLQRIGKKKNPSYRLIVSEKTKDTQAGTLENLGIYNPIVSPKVVKLNAERINYWISMGAQLSASVNNLLIKEGVIKGEKEKSVFLSKKRKEKMGVKKAEAEEAKVKAMADADAKARAEAEEVAKAKAEAEAKAKEEAEAEKVKAPAEAEKAQAPVEEVKEEISEVPAVTEEPKEEEEPVEVEEEKIAE